MVTAEGTKAGDNADLFRFITRTGKNWRAFAFLAQMEVPSMVGYIPPQPDLLRVAVSATGEVVALTEMVAETQRLEEGFKRLEHEAKWKRREDRKFRDEMKKQVKKRCRLPAAYGWVKGRFFTGFEPALNWSKAITKVEREAVEV